MSLYLNDPAKAYAAVTPHDTNELTLGLARGFYIGGAGNIVLQDVRGQNITFTAVVAGSILPVMSKLVRSTSTTATSIVALY